MIYIPLSCCNISIGISIVVIKKRSGDELSVIMFILIYNSFFIFRIHLSVIFDFIKVIFFLRSWFEKASYIRLT